MKYTDIAIIGGGLAGSIAAAMLGRVSIATVLVDPHPHYPPDFRVEKLSGADQLARFRRTGLAEAILPQATHDGENWIARFGRLLDKAPSQQFGIAYDALVNAIRREIPDDVERIYSKAIAVSTSNDRQKIILADQEVISARLVVIANGLNAGLRKMLGIEREIVSRDHSISIGFDIAPLGRRRFDFPALTYFSERPDDCSGRGQDPACRSHRQYRLSRRRPRASGRRLRLDLPGHRHRCRQGLHRRRTALQCPHSGLAGERGHGRGKDRGFL